jgi:hypothetical protein
MSNDNIREEMTKQILESRRDVKKVIQEVNPSSKSTGKDDLRKCASAVRNMLTDIEPLIKKHADCEEDGEALAHWYEYSLGEVDILSEVKRYHENNNSGRSRETPYETEPETVAIDSLEDFADRGNDIEVEVTYDTRGNIDRERRKLIPLSWDVIDSAYRGANLCISELGFVPEPNDDVPEGMEL